MSTQTARYSSPSTPSRRAPESLIPYVVARTEEQIFCVLPLIPCIPVQHQVRSSRDLILPPPGAFSTLGASLESVPPTYPPFHTHNYTWNGLLSLVQQPLLLWPSYAPKNLGEYPDIATLVSMGGWYVGRGCELHAATETD
ncbi:hypothetical protein BU17DRAFT_103592 [Hysterangium stoloniferum]|nr:hypothetical protein BU17DRAFT_103592 [Hysterangium stoloniferum]